MIGARARLGLNSTFSDPRLLIFRLPVLCEAGGVQAETAHNLQHQHGVENRNNGAVLRRVGRMVEGQVEGGETVQC